MLKRSSLGTVNPKVVGSAPGSHDVDEGLVAGQALDAVVRKRDELQAEVWKGYGNRFRAIFCSCPKCRNRNFCSCPKLKL
jgi:hypothetical protein